jgi:hypothetical protein
MVKEQAIVNHYRILGHRDFGVTELRIFDPIPMVAYADNEDDVVRLALTMEGKTSGIYIGVQPRLLDFFDYAPNRWVHARSKPHSNCATDNDIEYITTCFWDIDVVSEERSKGHPASEKELRQSSKAAKLMSRQDGLALTSVILCSGNGHYVLSPVVPILVDNAEIARQFRLFCYQISQEIAGQVENVKIDPVYNLSRVMRLMGTYNCKSLPVAGRPHRRAHFVTNLSAGISMALHYMILNTDVEELCKTSKPLPKVLRCDLQKLENCEFIQWCRAHPESVSQTAWWSMITNLAHLKGGIQLIHEISQLDRYRYDYDDTQQIIQRVIDAGYRPVSCKTIVRDTATCPGQGRFQCSRIKNCPAKAPMYMADLHTVYNR